jgi:hypothetical protein
MRAQEFAPDQAIREYEQGTPRARKIERTLTGAGYRRLGGGVESAAWAREDGPVIKVIMPSERSSTDLAMKSFLRFYRLTKKQPSPHWPRFQSMRDEAGRVSDFAEFKIDGGSYVQIAMERLYELNDGEALMVESIARNIAQGRSLKQWAKKPMPFYEKEFPRQLKGIRPQLPTLWAAMETAYGKTGGSYVWDMHSGNAMKRQDGTIVITDPFIRWDQ